MVTAKYDTGHIRSDMRCGFRCCLTALADEGRCTHTSPTDVAEEIEVITNELDSLIPFLVLSGRDNGRGIPHQPSLDEEALCGLVGNAAEEGSERNRDDTESERDSPLFAANSSYLERSTANEDDQNLNGNF